MRQGLNPLRFERAPEKINPIVFLVVTHLPCSDDPYHAGRMEIIQTCLTSMREHAHREHTFIVWDNGSKDELRDWIQHVFEPDIFIASGNIGKGAARTSAIQMLPPGTVVCYSDDDFYFMDNWLKPQMELLNYFPNVAAVSGYPCRTMFRSGNANTLAWAENNATLKRGQFIPRAWENDHARSIGRDPEEHIRMTVKDFDIKISYQKKEAYATAHHAQMIGYQIKLSHAMYYDDMAAGSEHHFDETLDRFGLRLCTTERYCRHMGNVLDPQLREQIKLDKIK